MFKSDFHHSDFKPARLVWRNPFAPAFEKAEEVEEKKEGVKKKESLKKELDVQQKRDKEIKKLLTTKRDDIENFLKDDLGDDLDPDWDALGESFLEIMGKDSDYKFLGHLQGMLYRKYPTLIDDVDVRNTGVGDKIFGPHTLGAIILYLKLECDVKSDPPAFYTQFRDSEKFAPGRDVLLNMMFGEGEAIASGSKMIAKSKGEIKEEVKAIEKLGWEHLWTKYFKALESASSDVLSDSATFITDGGSGADRGKAYSILRDRFYLQLRKTIEVNGEFDFDYLSQWVSAFERAGLSPKEIRALGLKVGDESEDGEKGKGDSGGEVEEGGDGSGVEAAKRGPSHNEAVVGAMVDHFKNEVTTPLENRYLAMESRILNLINANKDAPNGIVMRGAELGFRVDGNEPLQEAFANYRKAHADYHERFDAYDPDAPEAEEKMKSAHKELTKAVKNYYASLKDLNTKLDKEYKSRLKKLASRYSLPPDIKPFDFNPEKKSFSFAKLANNFSSSLLSKNSRAINILSGGVPVKTIKNKQDFLPYVKKTKDGKPSQVLLDRLWKEFEAERVEPIAEINRWIFEHNKYRFNAGHKEIIKQITAKRKKEEASLNDMPLNKLINVSTPRVS